MATSLSFTPPMDFILSEAQLMRSRTAGIVTQTGTAIRSGTVMGRITASGKYVPYNEAGADDGRRTAVGVLYNELPEATGDVKAVIFDTDCEVRRGGLIGLDANGEADLLARGIKVRGATGLLTNSTPAL